VVNITDIPDFPGLPGQRPAPGVPDTVTPVSVVLVSAPFDSSGDVTPLNAAAVDAFITAEIAAGRAYVATVERWAPWSPLDVQLDYASTVQYNYGRFTVGGKKFYAHVTVEYQNLTTTTLNPIPDDWTTYAPRLGYSTIVRGHIAVAASQSDTYGDNYMTAPEPVAATPERSVLSDTILDAAASEWRVVVVSANNLNGSGATPFFELHTESANINDAASMASAATRNKAGIVQTTVQSASYPWKTGADTYVPKVTPSKVSTIDGMTTGGGVYVFTLAGYAAYMTTMQGAPWVTNGIVSASVVPAWSVGGVGGGGSFTPGVPPLPPTAGAWATVAALPTYVGALDTATTTAGALGGWRDTVAASLGLGYYRKLLTSQFTQIVVSDGESENLFKPEVWKTSGVNFEVVTETTHGTASIRAIPSGYTALGDQRGVSFAFGGSEGAVQSGRGIATSDTAQQDMAPWMSAFTNSTTRIALTDQQDLAIALAMTNAQLTLGVQGIQTVLGAAGGASGGPLGIAAAGAAGLSSLATSAISANNNISMLDAANDGSFDIATYQLGITSLANYFSFEAWAQSLNAVSGRGSGHSLAGAWRAILGRGLDVLISVPTADAVARALSTWKRYGYMIERAFVPPRLDAMNNYTYWQLEDPSILGNMPDDARVRIGERFKRGTTVWSVVSEVGTQPANAPRAGISY